MLEVSENMDTFNTYRLRFRNIAIRYANEASVAYYANVYDLNTFMDFFPRIYTEKLGHIVQIAVDILILEGIWTITYDSFMQQHSTDYHLVVDDLETMANSIMLTAEANVQATAGLMSFIPNLVGGGFGFAGALKGIAGAAVFNIVRDGVEASALNSATKLKPAQQLELYQRINPQNLLHNLFLDYWRVFLSLVNALNQNGQHIWWPDDESIGKSSNIFKNISNPNFPKDRVLGAILDIIKINPYNAEYHKFIISRFGETEEVAAINDYFGYTNFDDSRIC